MRIAVVYVFPPNAGPQYLDWALRFIQCCHDFPAGIEHENVVALNGARATSEITCLFSSLPKVSFLEHDNSGFDIGAYQHAAREVPCDLMVFFGSSTYLRGPGWLKRMAKSFEQHGTAIYGTMGSLGHNPHIRTTAFWMPPTLLNVYPVKVTCNEQRYPAEHGRDCITQWVIRQGLRAWVVTWTGEYEWPSWNSIPNGFHLGDQSGLLAGDRLTEPPYHPVA